MTIVRVATNHFRPLSCSGYAIKLPAVSATRSMKEVFPPIP